MNNDTNNPADLPAGDAAPEEAAPKRRRSPAKAAAPVSESAEAPAAEAKPAKPRAPRKTAAAKAAEAVEAAEAPVAAVTEEAPAPKRRAPRKTAASAEAVATEAPAPIEPEAPPPAPPPDDGGEQPARAGAAEEGEGEAGEFGDDRGGRGRNRRRGRKGRGEGGEGQPQEGAEGAEGGRGGQRSFEPVEMAVAVEPEVAAAAGELFAEVLAGTFDGGEEPPELAEGEEVADTKRVLAADPDAPKLQKVLAQAGVGSRRDIEDMIAEGKIEVNGEVAHIGQRISFGDRVSVAGKQIRVRITPPAPRILAYHKPVGEVVTFNDPEGRPTVFRRLPRLQNGKWQSVGRLDLNTEGLLLFTNSGELANQLMHPRFGVEREYAVRVLGTLTPEQKARLLEGVEIEGQKAQFKSIEDGGGEGVNHWYRVVITEGRNREVRKLFDKVGLAVSRLMRIRYGTVVLPRGLKRGVWVELGDDDVRIIRRLAGHVRQERGDRNERGEQGGKPQQQQRGQDDKRGNNKRRPDGRQAGAGPRPSRPEPSQRQPEQRFDERPSAPRDHNEDDDDFVPRNINPLEQTFDRRFATGSKRIPQGFGAGGSAPDRHDGGRGKGKGDGPREPDPMQTSVGYIGGDAFLRRGGRGGGGGRSGGGGGRSGGGGGGGRSGGGGSFGGRKR